MREDFPLEEAAAEEAVDPQLLLAQVEAVVEEEEGDRAFFRKPSCGVVRGDRTRINVLA